MYTVTDKKKVPTTSQLFNGVYKKYRRAFNVVSVYFLVAVVSTGFFVTVVLAEFVFVEVSDRCGAILLQCSKKFINSPHWSIAAFMALLQDILG